MMKIQVIPMCLSPKTHLHSKILTKVQTTRILWNCHRLDKLELSWIGLSCLPIYFLKANRQIKG